MKTFILCVFCAITNFAIAQERYEFRYWFDTFDKSAMTMESYDSLFHFEADASLLPTGFHTFNFQLVNSQNGESTIKTTPFYKTSSYSNKNSIILIDGIPCKQYDSTGSQSSMMHLDIHLDMLNIGVHTLEIQLVDDAGIASPVMESFFLKVPTNTDLENMNMYYFIDDIFNGKTKCSIFEGMAHAELDMSTLTDGLHSITFLLGNSSGLTTQVKTSYFMKEPLGGNGIKAYKYWVNNDENNAYHKSYDTPQSSITLLDILDIPKYPLRTSNFHFTIENDVPVLYPKNTFHIQIQNASNNYVSSHSDYIDVTMPQILNTDKMPLLSSGCKESINDLESDEISWFKFKGEDGDSISLKSDKSCTIEIFSPNGELVQHSEGYSSINPNGFFLSADGNYYVAVHDICSSVKSTTIDFFQIEKYAIVDYDVHQVGNGGLSTIAVNGNGYYSLDSITITNGNIVVPCVDIKRLSNTKLEATFDFGGIPIGEYDFVFNFLDEDRTIPKGITVESAKSIYLSKDVKFDNVFYIGHKPWYDLEITNSGNSTAYRVPIYVFVATKLSAGIPTIDLSGINTPDVLEDVDMSNFTESECARLRDLEKSIGDNLNFIRFRSVDETGDSILISANYFFTDIPPMSTKKVSISISTSDEVQCYTVVPEAWNTYTNKTEVVPMLLTNTGTTAKDYFCCYHEKIECFLSIVEQGATIASIITKAFANAPASVIVNVISCTASILSNLSSISANVFCDENEDNHNLWEDLMTIPNTISYISLVKDCFLNLINLKKIGEVWDLIATLNNFSFSHANTTIQCLESFLSKEPNCPPVPPQGGRIEPIYSFDPNDILGYVSQSGSRFVGIEQDNLNYTIEFENDSTIATAPAHKIEIHDNLNPHIFDIKSIHTSRIKIGKHEFIIDKHGEFVETIDMRPSINALAELRLTVRNDSEIIYQITELDPMTLEPTMDIYTGILPVNNENNDGQGFVSFDVELNKGLSDGTIIDNSAFIVFDGNDAIETPVWSNETDYVRPVSFVNNIETIGKEKARVYFNGSDSRSGIWQYNLYYQPGEGSEWFLVKEGITETSYDLDVYEDINYGFCVIATDMAGNKEEKELSREYNYINGQGFNSITEIPIDKIPKTEYIYDLSGRRVHEISTPGIYIMKGKKIIVTW